MGLVSMSLSRISFKLSRFFFAQIFVQIIGKNGGTLNQPQIYTLNSRYFLGISFPRTSTGVAKTLLEARHPNVTMFQKIELEKCGKTTVDGSEIRRESHLGWF